ncbi:hypothetical protein TrLO_g10908 [Triparma laevis f. longispina]|uniref:GINS subunit domain-containing protein n=1 Tax=Triparma laevis f. longispina TaxID=1714387 RepID=A0A9W6ZSJ3_9STRA|nr:hypothetical protein TrLO_g10908 [Triparma laevis f. longispina]
MNFTNTASSLLPTLSRCTWLPPYPTSVLPQIFAEVQRHRETCNQVYQNGQIDSELSDSCKPILQLHLQSILRIKRILLAYMNARVEKITDLVYQSSVIPVGLRGLLSGEERSFNEDYNDLLCAYEDSIGVSFLEYSGGIHGGDGSTLPYMVEVQVNEDRGSVVDNGVEVGMGEGSRHWVRREAVEGMVRRGEIEQRDVEV